MSKKKALAPEDRRRSKSPNYAYWCSLQALRPFEATALSFDTDPDEFGPATGKSIEEALKFPNFTDRLRAIERQVGNVEGISPANLVTWMDEHRLEVPEGMRATISTQRSLAQTVDERLKAAEAGLAAAKAELEECKRQRDALIDAANMEKRKTMDRIAVGLAIDTYGWQPEDAKRQDYAAEIAKALGKLADESDGTTDPRRAWRKELRVHADTVRTQLNEALRRLQ